MVYIPGSLTQGKTQQTTGYTPGSLTQGEKKTTTAYVPGTLTSGKVSSSKDTQTSQGLYNIAEQNGLKDKADKILQAQAGEKPNEFFSGGFISDTFDVLNALQYGVTGMLKGKSFSEGIKTRQSFADKDALGDKGLPGIIAGTVLDIAFDPLTYIAPATIVRKVPLLSKVLKAGKETVFGRTVEKAIEGTENTYQAVEGGTKMGKYLASKLAYMQGADPVFKEMFERGSKNIAIETQAITEMGKAVANMAPETAAKILTKDETGRFIRTPLEGLRGQLSPEELSTVTNFYNRIDNLGKQATDLGLLSKEKYEENIGEYVKNAYTEYELAKSKGFFPSKPTGIKGIKARVEGLTPEQMKELGQIDNPAYLLFKSAFDMTKDVENAKLFKQVSDKFATDVAQEGFAKMPSGIKYGNISDKYVPQHIHDYLNTIIEPTATGLEKVGKDLVAGFKFAKVVMNPATHARNIMSNKILNYWKLGMNPLDPKVIASDIEAGKEILKGVGKWSDEARPLGYNVDTFASQEMKSLIDSPDASAWGKGSKLWQEAKKKLGDIYQNEENHAKLSAYIFNRKKGFSPEEAWKASESATFNYAQVTPFVRKLRESLFGFPFITFTVKSTPVVAETLVKNPERVSVLGKIKQNIEKLSDIQETERERASEPSWVKDGFYVKLPIKDSQGRSAYFDMTYILPFGDIVSGNFFERGQNMQTGLPESISSTALKKSPFIQLIGDVYRNKNFYGNKIWKESDDSSEQLKDLMTYLTKTVAPPLVADQLHNGYNEKGVKQFKGVRGALSQPDKANQQRTLMQELLRNVGAKIQPVDVDIQETNQEWNKKKGIQSLLLENGILNNFSRAYIPKK